VGRRNNYEKVKLRHGGRRFSSCGEVGGKRRKKVPTYLYRDCYAPPSSSSVVVEVAVVIKYIVLEKKRNCTGIAVLHLL
jgi:hypothetical protein